MEAFNAGTLAGAGSFHCDACGFAVALQERDAVPGCPACGGESFKRASLFGAVPAEEHTPPLEGTPEWLEETRATLEGGHYLAFEGDDGVRVVALKDGWTRIGRSLSADVRFDDPTVSRRHALVFCEDGGARILDDRSLNGVFRNGDCVELAELEDGDEIAVGRFHLHFISLTGEGSRTPEGAGSAVA